MEKKKSLQSVFSLLANYGIYIAFVILFVFFSVKSPAFRSIANIINIPFQVSYVSIIAVGMTFIIITAGIDLSVGSVFAFVGVIMVYAIENYGVPPAVGILFGLVAGSLMGACNGFLIVKFKLPPFISTLAMMSIGRGLARWVVDDRSIYTYNKFFEYIGNYRIGPESIEEWARIPVPVIIMLLIFGAGYVIQNNLRIGRYIHAIGGNEEASHLSGVNVNGVKMFVYTLCGLLGAISAVLFAARFPGGAVGDPKVGYMYELDAIAAVVVGGTSLFGGRGSIIGTLVGALLIGVLNNGMNLLTIPDSRQMVIKGVVIVFAVMLDQMKNRK